jgi:translation elongation factor P/translation initiation factor 5A
MIMDKVSFITVDEVEHAIIDRGNGEFTSMTKAHYEELEAAKAIGADEAKAK